MTALQTAVNLSFPFSCSAYNAETLFSILLQQLTEVGTCGISGQVVDISTNQLVSNVGVVVRQDLSTGSAIIRSTQTDSSGRFIFTNLPPGNYQMSVEGFYSSGMYSYFLTNNQFRSSVMLYMYPVPTNTSPSNAPIYTNDSSPALTVDANGIPHIVWSRGAEIWHAYHNGNGWISTGALPDATGVEPRIVACSNLFDGVSAGVLIAWQTAGTSNSSIRFAVGGTVTNLNAWRISSPVLLNETNVLLNQGLALAVQPDGQVLAVWQKSSTAVVDDTDLYYRMLRVESNLFTWTAEVVAEAKFNAAPMKESFGETCVSLDLDFGEFDVPNWLLGVGGTYKFSAGGELCGMWDCNPSFTLTGGNATVELPFFSVSGSVEGSAAWKVDPSKCSYVFDSAAVTYTISLDRTFQLPRRKFGNLPVYAQLGSKWSASGGGSLGWEEVNFPSWPNRDSSTFNLKASLYGQARGYVSWIHAVVSGTATAEAALEAKMNMFEGKKWDFSVTVASIFEGQAGPVKFKWKLDDTFPNPKSNFRSHLVGASDITLTVDPVTGTTNVYEGNPVMADVVSNVVPEGNPDMVLTTAGDTFLAWTMDSQTPGVELGNRVLVARWQSSAWGAPLEVPHSWGFNSDVKVALDSLERPLLVWVMASSATVGLTNTANEIVAAMSSNNIVFSTFNNFSWSEPARLPTIAGYNRSIVLGHDAQRHVLASWITDEDNVESIYAAWWDGSTWSEPSLVTKGAISGDLAISVVGGAATVLWTQDFGDTNNAMLRIISSACDPITGQWATPQVFTTLESISTSSLVRQKLAAKMSGLFSQPTPPSSCCEKSNPKNTPPAPTSTGPSDVSQADQAVGSQDPNAKIGPSGFGGANYVDGSTHLSYIIEFENSTNATAPAQQVNIWDPLDSQLDADTFELAEVVFGSQRISIPPNSQYFETNIPMMYNGISFDVEIDAGIDLATGEVFADFYSINPATYLPPDVMIGFLPPEDGTGRGQGHISYFVRPKAGLSINSQITNIAYIQFDVNPIISTDQIDPHDLSKGFDTNKMAVVTIDCIPPVSSVASLPYVSTNSDFIVSWSGTDAGAGIVSYDIYVASNGGAWTAWLTGTTNSSLSFQGVMGNRYSFYSIAHDGVGNVESAPTSAEATTIVAPHLPPEFEPLAETNQNQFAAVGGHISFTNTAHSPNLPITYSLDSSAPAGASISTNGVFAWTPSCGQGSTTNVIRIWATDSYGIPLSNSVSFVVAVSECLQLNVGSTVLQVGQTSSVPLGIVSTLNLTNLSFTVVYPANRFTNWGITPSHAAIGATRAQSIDGAQTAFNLAAKEGQKFNGPSVLGRLTFKALPASSAFVPLTFADVVGTKSDGSAVGNSSGQPGRVVVIGAEPLLEGSMASNSTRMLTLYGNPGSSYQTAFITNIASTNWQQAWRVPMTNLQQYYPVDQKASQISYRAWEFFADPPLLEMNQGTRTNLTLLLYGRTGTNYALQATTNLTGTPIWYTNTSFTLTNSFRFTDITNQSNGMMFFRAKRP